MGRSHRVNLLKIVIIPDYKSQDHSRSEVGRQAGWKGAIPSGRPTPFGDRRLVHRPLINGPSIAHINTIECSTACSNVKYSEAR